jgi:hypothetical protein
MRIVNGFGFITGGKYAAFLYGKGVNNEGKPWENVLRNNLTLYETESEAKKYMGEFGEEDTYRRRDLKVTSVKIDMKISETPKDAEGLSHERNLIIFGKDLLLNELMLIGPGTHKENVVVPEGCSHLRNNNYATFKKEDYQRVQDIISEIECKCNVNPFDFEKNNYNPKDNPYAFKKPEEYRYVECAVASFDMKRLESKLFKAMRRFRLFNFQYKSLKNA